MPFRLPQQNIKMMTKEQAKRAVKNPQTARGRQQTSIACVHCTRSKTRCAVERPCPRCVRLNKTCTDRPLKLGKQLGIEDGCQHPRQAKISSPNDAASIQFPKLLPPPTFSPSLSLSSLSSGCSFGSVGSYNEIVTYHQPADISTNSWCLPYLPATQWNHQNDSRLQEITPTNPDTTGLEHQPLQPFMADPPESVRTTSNYVNISQKIHDIMQSVESGINARELSFCFQLQSIEADLRAHTGRCYQ